MGHRRKKRTHSEVDDNTLRRIPRSMVFKMGSVTKSVKQLSRDIRKMMLPWTASNLKERRNANIKDYLHVGGVLHISHMLVVSQPKVGVRLSICRTKGGEGPTSVFDVVNYSLASDIRRSQYQSRSTLNDFKHPPIMVTQGFKKPADDVVTLEQLGKVSHVFASMFPSINAKDARRLIILCYSGSNIFDLRHYVVFNKQTRNVKKTKRQKLEQKEIKEEPLDEDDQKKQLNNDIELIELGPRLTLRLVQVHDGVFNKIQINSTPMVNDTDGQQDDADTHVPDQSGGDDQSDDDDDDQSDDDDQPDSASTSVSDE